MKTLLIRSASGAVYVLLIIGSLVTDKYLFALVGLLFNILGQIEFQRLGKCSNKQTALRLILSFPVYLIPVFAFAGIIELKWITLCLLVPLLLLSVELYNNNTTSDVFRNSGFSIGGIIYITVPLVLLNYLNFTQPLRYSHLILSVFLLIWANDTFAYLSGMAFGKHKLFERITPKKTWEGFIGGIIATLLLAWILRNFVGFGTVISWEILALVISITAVFGDFIESMFKRTAGVKDSGTIMPGHGGILDRIDSMLFVFPVVFIYFVLVN